MHVLAEIARRDRSDRSGIVERMVSEDRYHPGSVLLWGTTRHDPIEDEAILLFSVSKSRTTAISTASLLSIGDFELAATAV